MDQLLDNVKQFLNQYPKTKQQLLVWYKSSLQSFQASLASEEEESIEIPGIEMDMMEEMVPASMTVNPRFMYEFFDEHGFKVFLQEAGPKFSYSISGEVSPTSFSSRIEAEQEAFKKCFEKTENKLTTI